MYVCVCVCMNIKKFLGICLKRLHLRVMPRNMSEKANMLIYWLTHGQLLHSTHSKTSGIVNDIQPCPKRCLLMLLAHVGARTDSTMRAATTRGVANFRAHALAYVQYMPRVLHFSAFHNIKMFLNTLYTKNF